MKWLEGEVRGPTKGDQKKIKALQFEIEKLKVIEFSVYFHLYIKVFG